MALTFGLLLPSSCDVVYDGIEECPLTSYELRLRYDYNIKRVDAFGSEVRSVALWVFDHASGAPVATYSVGGDALGEEGYALPLGALPAGVYDMVAWCGLQQGRAWAVADAPAVREELSARLSVVEPRSDALPTAVSTGELNDLYYGRLDAVVVEKPERPATVTLTMPLVKDTNRLRLVLQQQGTDRLDPAAYDLRLVDANEVLSWENLPAGNSVNYLPHAIGSATTGDDGATPYSVLTADFTTSRLPAAGNRLVVTRLADGKRVLDIPLSEYLLLVKGHYPYEMTDQEYLDRQDQYSLIFLLNGDDSWDRTAGIYVNSWRVVPPQKEEM